MWSCHHTWPYFYSWPNRLNLIDSGYNFYSKVQLNSKLWWLLALSFSNLRHIIQEWIFSWNVWPVLMFIHSLIVFAFLPARWRIIAALLVSLHIEVFSFLTFRFMFSACLWTHILLLCGKICSCFFPRVMLRRTRRCLCSLFIRLTFLIRTFTGISWPFQLLKSIQRHFLQDWWSSSFRVPRNTPQLIRPLSQFRPSR